MQKSQTISHILLTLVLFLFCAPSVSAEERKEWDYGKLTTQLRYYYFTQRDKDKDTKDLTNKESLALGGFLKYETPWMGDMFQGGIAGYTSQPFPSDFNRASGGGTQLLSSKNQGITALGEAYLKGKVSETEGTVYRQRIETPMVNGNDSRMIPQTFEAYSVTSNDFDDLMLQAAWVDKIKKRDTEMFRPMGEFTGLTGLDNSNRGMFMLGADWSPKPFKLRGWHYTIPNAMQMLFLQAGASHDIEEDLALHWLVQGLDQREAGSADGGSFNVGEIGALGGVTVNGVKLEVGATIVDNTTNVINGWATYPFFNNMMSFANNRAGERALFLGASYDFNRIGWNGFTSSAKASFGSTPSSGSNASPDRNEYNLNFNYAFDGALKGFSILNRWSYQETKNEKDGMQVRLRFQYDFQLM